MYYFTLLMGRLCFLLFPVSFIGFIITITRKKPSWKIWGLVSLILVGVFITSLITGVTIDSINTK